MAIRGVSITLEYLAYNPTTGAYVPGDVANHTLSWVKDGVRAAPTNAAAEVDAVNAPGVYKVTLTVAEMTCDTYMLCGKSSAANVILIPTSGTTEHGVLPTVQQGNNGAVMTSGSNVGPWSVSGGVTFTNAAGAGFTCSSSGGNGAGFSITGNGSGAGLSCTGGATGAGILGTGGATSGSGMSIQGTAVTASPALVIKGVGSSPGVQITPGGTGTGVNIAGGSASGGAITLTATSGDALAIVGGGTGAAMRLTGGTTGPGLVINGGSSSGDAVDISWTSANFAGVYISGPGTACYMLGTGVSGAIGLRCQAQGSGTGIVVQGGPTGTGISVAAGSQGVILQSTATGPGLNIVAGGGSNTSPALTITASAAGGHGIAIQPGANSWGINIAAAGGSTSGGGIQLTGAGATNWTGLSIAASGTGNGIGVTSQSAVSLYVYSSAGIAAAQFLGVSGPGISITSNGGHGLQTGTSNPGSAGWYAYNSSASGMGALIAGPGASVTTISGGLVIRGGNAGDGLTVTSIAPNGNAVSLAGNGAGCGLLCTAGATGIGAQFNGGATSGDAVVMNAIAAGRGLTITAVGAGQNGVQINSGTNANGMFIQGDGGGAGINCQGGATGNGFTISGGNYGMAVSSTSLAAINTAAGPGMPGINGTLQGDLTGRILGNSATPFVGVGAQTTLSGPITISGPVTVAGNSPLNESYPPLNGNVTLEQAVYEILQVLSDFYIAGSNLNVRKRDRKTIAEVFALDDPQNPTSRTRTA